MVRIKKWILIFGPKISVLGPKIRFLPYDPNFGQWPIFSHRHDGWFPTLGSIFRLSVPELQFFVKKTWLTHQKVFPLPTVRAPSASNSPGALSPARFALGLDKKKWKFNWKCWSIKRFVTQVCDFCLPPGSEDASKMHGENNSELWTLIVMSNHFIWDWMQHWIEKYNVPNVASSLSCH